MKALRVVFLSLVSAAMAAGPLGGCQTNPATGRTQLRLVPADQVSQMGLEAKPQLIEEYGGEVPERQLREYITEIGTRLAEGVEPEFADIQWSFIVLDSDVINAFALPGGNVFISRGLLARFTNEAQVAGVLGHEIGHVTGQHVDERISQAVTAEIGLGLLGAITDSQLAMVAAQLVSGGYQLSFGRDQEIEADTLGVRYMVNAGYDPQGMLEVLDVLRAASEGAGQPPEFLSTHPHPGTRIDTVTRLLRRDYAYTQGSADYQKFEGRFETRAAPHLQRPSASSGQPDMAIAAFCATCATHHAPAVRSN